MTHTPGPWTVTADEEKSHLHPLHAHRFIEAASDDQHPNIIARMSDMPNQAANARLIAAAPDLLDACANLIHAINMSHTTSIITGFYDADIYYNGADFGPALDTARAAIAEPPANLHLAGQVDRHKK